MKEYPKLGTPYYNHEGKIGEVKVLSIAKHYNDDEEYVVYQGVHTGTIGVIKLSDWNEMVETCERIGCVNERPRIYCH